MSRWTVRARLTVLYGSVALVSSGLLLAALLFLLDRSIAEQVIVPPDVVLTSQPVSDQAAIEAKQRLLAAETRLRVAFQEQTVPPLVADGLLAVGGLTLVGLAAGWFVAGRTLRPIHQITATARRVADRNLHERIALTGPRDELRELADTFDEMLSRLDASFEGQRTFVGNASHELKTPLAINRTLLEVAMNRPDAPPQLRQLGETLLEVNARHETLVDGLLTLARSQHAITKPVAVNLAEVADRVVGLAAHEFERLTVTVHLDAGDAPVSGDPLLLERLTQNLVQNAIRYNTPGGWVRVRTGRVDGRSELTVSNTGPVVTPASIPSLFEPFQRVTNRVGSARGTGLGLSIVRSVVQAHGGEVTAAARDGGGMTVTVALP
ncbi:MAG: HAMP domain-containing sensor histidine kinase [Kibdelosporangium sp.]